ncbi:MAG: DUF4365 domain-containing protein, partial [Candidatus Omnitrophica bacterium]|nr:DUF4365 domain-containing protein [Candidatus Omnitrophota bacterium]
MNFPKRATSHIQETISWKIFQQKVSNKWIIRNVSERDYGIDAYVEMINNKSEITGDICFIQLKDTRNITWKNNNARQNRIKKETIS